MGATIKVVNACIYICVLNRTENCSLYRTNFFFKGGEDPGCVVLLACLIVEKLKPMKQFLIIVIQPGEKRVQILIQGVKNSSVIWQ